MLDIQYFADAFYQNQDLDEIICQGPTDFIYIQGHQLALKTRPPHWQKTWSLDIQEFAFAEGQRLDPHWPSAGGIYWSHNPEPLQLRWHAVMEPISTFGPIFAIRRHRFDSLGLNAFGGWSPNLRRQFDQAFTKERPIFVYGLTGAGKSSFLAALLREYCSQERVAILEEHHELPLLSRYWLNLCCCPPRREGGGAIDMTGLFKEVLRLRPDRVVIGEVRCQQSGAALGRLLDTGHGGVLTSFHAADRELMVSRLKEVLQGTGWQTLERMNPLIVELKRGSPPHISHVGLFDGDADDPS